jgi:hypothetical protein
MDSLKIDSDASGKVALIIIFNHRYDKNIDALERIYKNKFSHICHLVPFYDGDKPNVIPVYENSHYFQGYIAQGFKFFFRQEYSHYIFIADDLILNPVINEHNYQEMLGLSDKSSFLVELLSFHKLEWFWDRNKEAYEYKLKKAGVEASAEIPSYAQAMEIFAKFKLEPKPLMFDRIYSPENLHVSPEQFAVMRDRYATQLFHLSYPLVGAYSDISVVSAGSIRKFCHYCGVFAATDLFAEVALPTALVLSADEIVLGERARLHGKSIWAAEESKTIRETCHHQLKNLLEQFPSQYLYLHPIKLSKWDTAL